MTDKVDGLNPWAGKTLVVSWSFLQEWRCTIPPGSCGISTAITQALRESGITQGIPGIDVNTLRFEIE